MSITEYRVRPITRYIITRYKQDGNAASSIQVGEFVSEDGAALVASALIDLDLKGGIVARMASAADSFDALISSRETAS